MELTALKMSSISVYECYLREMVKVTCTSCRHLTGVGWKTGKAKSYFLKLRSVNCLTHREATFISYVL